MAQVHGVEDDGETKEPRAPGDARNGSGEISKDSRRLRCCRHCLLKTDFLRRGSRNGQRQHVTVDVGCHTAHGGWCMKRAAQPMRIFERQIDSFIITPSSAMLSPITSNCLAKSRRGSPIIVSHQPLGAATIPASLIVTPQCAQAVAVHVNALEVILSGATAHGHDGDGDNDDGQLARLGPKLRYVGVVSVQNCVIFVSSRSKTANF